MKKRLLWIFLFLGVGLILICLFTNPKIEKWTYDLPNDYAIKKTAATKVVLGKYIDGFFEVEKDDKQIGIQDYIAEFSYGKNIIALKCLVEKENNIHVNFYIVDTKQDYIYGPYQDEETYESVKEKIVDEELSDWVETTTRPEGAIDK